MRKYPEVTQQQRIEIIEYWKSNKDNSTEVLALKFNLKRHQVDEVINSYLKEKTKNNYRGYTIEEDIDEETRFPYATDGEDYYKTEFSI